MNNITLCFELKTNSNMNNGCLYNKSYKKYTKSSTYTEEEEEEEVEEEEVEVGKSNKN